MKWRDTYDWKWRQLRPQDDEEIDFAFGSCVCNNGGGGGVRERAGIVEEEMVWHVTRVKEDGTSRDGSDRRPPAAAINLRCVWAAAGGGKLGEIII